MKPAEKKLQPITLLPKLKDLRGPATDKLNKYGKLENIKVTKISKGVQKR